MTNVDDARADDYPKPPGMEDEPAVPIVPAEIDTSDGFAAAADRNAIRRVFATAAPAAAATAPTTTSLRLARETPARKTNATRMTNAVRVPAHGRNCSGASSAGVSANGASTIVATTTTIDPAPGSTQAAFFARPR